MTKRSATAWVAVAAFTVGGLAAQFMPRLYAQEGAVKGPKLAVRPERQGSGRERGGLHAQHQEVRVRVHRDENIGNLIYVSEYRVNRRRGGKKGHCLGRERRQAPTARRSRPAGDSLRRVKHCNVRAEFECTRSVR